MVTPNRIERKCGGMNMLPISSIRTDGGTQPRAAIDFDAVDDYSDAMAAGVQFPPLDVFYDGSDYWLADGFHRLKASVQEALSEVAVVIHQGTQQDAQWFSFAANKTNGLRRTNEDKQRAVKAALVHPGGTGKSDQQIAKWVGVAVSTVGDWRKKLNPTIGNLQSPKRSGSDGRTINTANIGRRPMEVREANGRTKVGASPAEDAVQRTEEPYSIDAALINIMLDIMTSPLHLREELIRRLRKHLTEALGELGVEV